MSIYTQAILFGIRTQSLGYALPPLIALGFLAAAAVLEAIMPLPVPVWHSLARYVPGAMLAAGGLIMIAAGTRLFAAAGTNIPPTLPVLLLLLSTSTFRAVCRLLGSWPEMGFESPKPTSGPPR